MSKEEIVTRKKKLAKLILIQVECLKSTPPENTKGIEYLAEEITRDAVALAELVEMEKEAA